MNNLNLYPFQHILREYNRPLQSDANSFLVDIEEDDKQYRIYADLPGIDKKQVSVKVENNVLSIRAEIAPRKSESIVRSERAHGEFLRSFRLPQKVDAENISASLKNGVLTVQLPKSATAAGRAIEIN